MGGGGVGGGGWWEGVFLVSISETLIMLLQKLDKFIIINMEPKPTLIFCS